MIAKARVYLNRDKSAAVPDGHKDAAFLLVAAGGEIADSQLERYKGAKELASGEAPEESRPLKGAELARHREQEKAKGHRASD